MLLARVGLIAIGIVLTACSPVHEITLDNGLKVVVKEDRRSPVVVSQIWYKVGAVDEPKGLTGISHVLEHMMFKGTQRHAAGEFSRIIAENGGVENAFTGSDYTAYYQQLEKSRLPVSFELEADRMQNLLLKEEEFRKERQVVIEERRLRTEDNPASRLYERFTHTAFQAHPYKNPIIGWMPDLERLQLKDLQAWYKRWYVPNNATLVVVGDVQAKEVFALAREHFGSIPRGKLDPASIPVEPPQKQLRRLEVALPAEVPNLIIGFHAPCQPCSPEAWEAYALDVLVAILDGGNSTRLVSDLVRKRQIAASIDTEYSPYARYPVLVHFSGTPASGHSVKELETAILEHIARLQQEPVSLQELKRVKAQVVAGQVYGQDSIFYQAMQIGMLETIGAGWRVADDYVERVRAVTAEQIQAVANKYLVEANMTVAVLNPQPMGKRKQHSRPSLGGQNEH